MQTMRSTKEGCGRASTRSPPKRTGRLRPVQDTVILEVSICDGCTGWDGGMPFLWHEIGLRRVEPQPSLILPSGACSTWRAVVAEKGRTALAVKRGIDVAGAAAAMVVLWPVLAWTALAVAATQGLPILFRHERPGSHGQPFTMYKFRTMRRRVMARSGTDGRAANLPARGVPALDQPGRAARAMECPARRDQPRRTSTPPQRIRRHVHAA